MTYDPNALKIYVDGSAYRNPGHEGGFACIVEYPDSLNLPNEAFTLSYKETTNNRMELSAAIHALERGWKIAKPHRVSRVIIFTDSEYVYQNKDRAVHWKRQKWRNREGRPIENPDLWQKLLSARNKSQVLTEIHWMRGKTTEILKEVDRAAKKAAKNILKIDDVKYRRGKIARAKVKEGSASLFPAHSQKEVIRVYRKEYKRAAGIEETKIVFEVYDPNESEYGGKYFAYANTKLGSELHRAHHYEVQFNGNQKYPIIEEIVSEVDPAESG